MNPNAWPAVAYSLGFLGFVLWVALRPPAPTDRTIADLRRVVAELRELRDQLDRAKDRQ